MEALRESVRTGRLDRGTKLPSSRSLAYDLGISRNTVVEAYGELVAEGWLTAAHGSGTRVADWVAPPEAEPDPPARPRLASPAHDLQAGRPDASSFPRAQWARSTRRALAAAPDEAFGYGATRGRIELRAALAAYLARVRGVRTDPDHIIICSGAMHGLMLLENALRARRVRTVAVESYSLRLHHDALAPGGGMTRAIDVDEYGARVDQLANLPDAGAVLLTPAHQFPTGVALHPDRRATVLNWARDGGRFVLEDDYDGEFRYDRQPVGALQGLAPEHVVYLGTASKSLAPGLRLGWLVVPQSLRADLEQAKGDQDLMTGVVGQLTLADFINSGAYDRHIRAMRLTYRRRRDQLVAALADIPDVSVSGLEAGLHAIVALPGGSERTVLEAAGRRRLNIEGLGFYRHPEARPLPDALVVGYATPSPSAWSGALRALLDVLPRQR
jgi:GntR family transcriptional regulator/MocR family aminotransferase